MKLRDELIQLAKDAQTASRELSVLSSQTKNKVLKSMSLALLSRKEIILKANSKDLAAAKLEKLPKAFIERLTLSDKKIKEMSDSLVELTKLADPVGEVIKAWRRPNGLWIHKVRTPIGVVMIIFESRPNVTSDCIGLCFKSGNSVILRGGSESFNTNLAIFNVLRDVIVKYGIAENVINLVATKDRSAIDLLLKLNDYIDLVMPRGGEGLINHVVNNSRIPVIKHYKGICHVYVDECADLNMAQNICFNAKVQRPGVCNAMESMLVHKDVAARFLPGMLKKLIASGVQIRGCALTRRIVKGVKELLG